MTRLTSIAQRFAVSDRWLALSLVVFGLLTSPHFMQIPSNAAGGAYSIEVGAYDPVQVRLKVIDDNGQSLADKVVLAEVIIVQ